MRSIALLLACVGPALASTEQLLHQYGLPEVPYPYLVACVPALLYSLKDSVSTPSFAFSLPIVACLGIAALSLVWVDPTERGRGTIIVATMLTGVTVSFSIVRMKAQLLCAQTFILASFVNLLLVFINTIDSDGRLGELIIEEYSFASNPNAFGGQMAAAAILTISLFVIDRDRLGPNKQGILTNNSIAISLAVLFCLATVMSASRGAILSLGLVIALLVFGNRFSANRVFGVAVVLSLSILLLFARNDLISPVIDRFSDGENVATLGDRLPIWSAAVEAVADSHILGYGIGGVEKALAEYYPFREGVKTGEDGIRRKASHNSYVEWFVATGLFGLIPACWLLVRILRRAILIDRKCGTVYRRALLAYCCLLSISSMVYRLPYAIPIAALLVASLSESAVVGATARTSSRKAFKMAERRVFAGVSRRRGGLTSHPTTRMYL